jgi:hypothetical protein
LGVVGRGSGWITRVLAGKGRAADAHAVLAPALEGFSPTPEFPEIEEAQTLLAAPPLLANQRRRRLPSLARR